MAGSAVLEVGDSGPEVLALQQALNERAAPRFYPPLLTDAEFGEASLRACGDLGCALGLLPASVRGRATVGAQRILLDPDRRDSRQRARAAAAAARLAQRTIVLDGTPVFWGLAKPLLRARRAGWRGMLLSADRRQGVAEQFGKKSQAALFACSQARIRTGRCPPSCGGDCLPANPPGRSSHELCSDAQGFPGPAGRTLEWWELGLDVTQWDSLIAKLRGLGYAVRQPYHSGTELHHVNFCADPGPVVQLQHRPPAPAPRPRPRPRPAPARTLTGPDVAEHQPDVDWNKVARAGRGFAFARVSLGGDYPDKAFGPGRWKAMGDAGLIRGAYHYLNPRPGRTGAAEARFFWKRLTQAGGLQAGDLPPVIDIEESRLPAAQTLRYVESAVEYLAARTGRRPIIYTGVFWREGLGNPTESFGCPLWLAAYVRDPTPYLPRAWSSWTFWQQTDRARVAGVPTPCDVSRFHAGRRELRALLL